MVFGFDTYPDRDVISGLFLSKSTGEDKAVKYQAEIYLSAVSTTTPHCMCHYIYFLAGEVNIHLLTNRPTII